MNNNLHSANIDVMTLDEILNDQTTPPAPIIDDGVLLEDTILLVYGEPKSRKTFLALNWALAIAHGKDFAGFRIPNPHKVLVLSAEGGYFPNRDRIHTMAKDFSVDKLKNFNMCFRTKINICNEVDYQKLKSLIDKLKPKVVVLDPLIRFHNADENSATQMAEVFTRLRELIKLYNLSFILIHHTGKDESREARGSSVIMSEYDSRIHIKTADATSTLIFDMRHVSTPENRNIRFNDEIFWFEVDNQEDSNPVSNALIKKGGTAQRRELVEILMNEFTYSQSGAYDAIKRELEKGIIYEDNGIIKTKLGPISKN